jgi:hypothetical protein
MSGAAAHMLVSNTDACLSLRNELRSVVTRNGADYLSDDELMLFAQKFMAMDFSEKST